MSDSVKMLDGSYKSYDDYMESQERKAENIFGENLVEISDDQLPF